MTYQVDIINPKATKLLKDLADLNLISIKQSTGDGFEKVLLRLRKKAASEVISLEEITKEVEKVRLRRHGKKKRKDHH